MALLLILSEFFINIRFATVEEIIAMKIDVISRGGRKKDFWDIHELMADYSFEQMLNLHKERYPYGHETRMRFELIYLV